MHFSTVLRHSVLNRRRWEKRVASLLSENKNSLVDSAARRYERIYKERRFTPVEKAFPTLGEKNVDASALLSAAPTLASMSNSSLGVPSIPPDSRVLSLAVVGPQNAGKSALVNAIALSSVGAVSSRYGSTSECTKAVATVHSTQLVLFDTPGVFVSRKRHSAKDLRWFGGKSAWALDTLFSVDLALLTLPVGLGFVEDEHKKVALEVAERAEARELPLVLALTMMDKVQTPRHKEMYLSFRTDLESLSLSFDAIHEVSVKGGSGLVGLKDSLCTFSQPGPWKFFRHETTDLSPVERVAEILRQAYLDLLPHEIPHRLRQKVIGWTKKPNNSTEVVVEVFFDRPAYVYVFYSKLEAIAHRAHQLILREWGEKYFFVLQGFVSPGGVST